MYSHPEAPPRRPTNQTSLSARRVDSDETRSAEQPCLFSLCFAELLNLHLRFPPTVTELQQVLLFCVFWPRCLDDTDPPEFERGRSLGSAVIWSQTTSVRLTR